MAKACLDSRRGTRAHSEDGSGTEPAANLQSHAVWLVGFRDLQWRRKRFFIAVLATALLFSVTLLLAGIAASFRNEVRRTLNEVHADAWIVPSGTVGPFTSTNLFPAAEARRVAGVSGVTRADPLLLFHETIRTPKPKDLNVIGYVAGGVGEPRVTAGRLPKAAHEMVIDRSFGNKLDSTVMIARESFRVVGTVTGITYLGGTATAFVSVIDAQNLVLRGAPLATAIVTRGEPRGPLPRGYVSLSNDVVRTDLTRPLASAIQTIGLLNVLLWIIAAGIIAAILYMSALERVREFAVIKAMGAANGFVVVGLASQAVVLALAAAVVAFALALVLAPAFPMSVEIPIAAYVELIIVAVTVGCVGSLAGLRRVLTVDPSVAFGGA
jgi:putative ABC transport system permease protein